jgi:hypothetical protein
VTVVTLRAIKEEKKEVEDSEKNSVSIKINLLRRNLHTSLILDHFNASEQRKNHKSLNETHD